MPGTKTALSLTAKYKKFNYWSALVLALLVTPFASQAMSDNGTFEADNNTQAGQSSPSTNQPKTEVKASVDKSESSSTSSVEIGTQQSTDSDNSEVDVTINGKKVPMPKSGSLHKEVTDNNSQTVVDVQIDNESSSSSETSSSTSIEVNSHSFGNSGAQSRRPSRR